MPRRKASSVPAPSIAPSGIHDREVTDDSMRNAGSFGVRPHSPWPSGVHARGLRSGSGGGERSATVGDEHARVAPRADPDQLGGGLSGEQWRLPVVHGWDVGELLRHLEAPAGPGPEATL